MDSNNSNPSYWFVRLEDQVILSRNNFTLQNPQIAGSEARYIISASDNKQYLQLNPVQETETIFQSPISEKQESIKQLKDDIFWDRCKVRLFLTLCSENRIKNSTVTNAQEEMMWCDIANLVGTNIEECTKKFKNLQRTYIRLLKKKRTGKQVKWIHYDLCEEVFRDCKQILASAMEHWEDSKVRMLLNLYIKNMNRFRSQECLQKDIWREIAAALGSTQYNCYHKFKSLKRTYINCLEKSRSTGKNVKWEYHPYFEKIFYNHSLTRGPWNRNKTRLLLDAYTKIAHKFRNPKYFKKDLWRELSEIVGESPENCDKKFRNLKQTYIRLKSRINSGLSGSGTKWRYYQEFEKLYCNHLLPPLNNVPGNKYSQDDYIIQLLTLYIANKDKFENPLVKKNQLWKTIADKVGLFPDECHRKFRNLKQTYLRLISEGQRGNGKRSRWPYFSYFKEIYGDQNPKYIKTKSSIDNEAFSEIKRVVEDMQEKQVQDRNFDRLMAAVQESNYIQKERNKILLAILNK